MKLTSRIALTACLCAFALPPTAQANDAVFGAVVGALLGQAVGGRDGAIVGGALGAFAGAASATPDTVVRVAPPPVYPPQVIYASPGYYAPAYGAHPSYGYGYVYQAPPPVVVVRNPPVVVITNEYRHRHGHWHGHSHRHWHR